METYYLQKLCILSTECVLIDIIVTISTVGTGCNFLHGEVSTRSHHIKTYNRLTISYTVCVHSHQLLTNDTFQE